MTALSEANLDLWRDLEGGDVLRICLTCGSCVSDCPASEADPPLLIRTLLRMVELGLEDNLLEEDTPWSCVTCSRCEEVCPMDVRPFEICLALRRWQCRNDSTRIPLSTTEIYQRGYTQPVDRVEELRRSVGLSGKLPVITADPELLAKFQAMLMEIDVIRDHDFMFKG